jgi:hypothetical protein
MIKKDDHSNIFDFSARQRAFAKKKPPTAAPQKPSTPQKPTAPEKKTTAPQKTPPQPPPSVPKQEASVSAAAAPPTAAPAVQAPKLLSHEEVEALFERMHKMNKEIEDKFNIICEKGGISPKDLEKYLRGISGTMMDEYKQKKAMLEQRMWSALGEKAKATHIKKQQDKSVKKRKSKSIGARKKNWISTR